MLMHQHPQHTVIITGGNAGLGYECAYALARACPQMLLVLACRNPSKATSAVQQLQRRTGHAHIETLALDLASLSSVRAFVRTFTARSFPPLSAVVCNAGVQIVSGTTYSEDGYETTFAVNHLGHFLLINLLFPSLPSPARIVFVSSGTHDPDQHTGLPAPRYHGARALAWPERDPEEAREDAVTSGRRRYTTSKLCNILCTYELARRIGATVDPGFPPSITVNAFDPGMMPGSGLARDYDPFRRFIWTFVLPIIARFVPHANTLQSSGQALAQLVYDKAWRSITGTYIANGRPISSSALSYDRGLAEELWETSEELAGIAEHERGSLQFRKDEL